MPTVLSDGGLARARVSRGLNILRDRRRPDDLDAMDWRRVASALDALALIAAWHNPQALSDSLSVRDELARLGYPHDYVGGIDEWVNDNGWLRDEQWYEHRVQDAASWFAPEVRDHMIAADFAVLAMDVTDELDEASQAGYRRLIDAKVHEEFDQLEHKWQNGDYPQWGQFEDAREQLFMKVLDTSSRKPGAPAAISATTAQSLDGYSAFYSEQLRQYTSDQLRAIDGAMIDVSRGMSQRVEQTAQALGEADVEAENVAAQETQPIDADTSVDAVGAGEAEASAVLSQIDGDESAGDEVAFDEPIIDTVEYAPEPVPMAEAVEDATEDAEDDAEDVGYIDEQDEFEDAQSASQQVEQTDEAEDADEFESQNDAGEDDAQESDAEQYRREHRLDRDAAIAGLAAMVAQFENEESEEGYDYGG